MTNTNNLTKKLGLPFFWISLLVVSVLVVVFLLLGKNPFTQAGAFFSLLGLVLSDMLFWFALAFLVILWVGNTAKNEVSLLGMASQKLIKDKLSPVVNAYEDQFQKQQHWVNHFKWIAPSIITQESLNYNEVLLLGIMSIIERK